MKTRMKKKELAEPIVSPEILALAKKSIESERPQPGKRCAVCGGSCTPLTGPHTSRRSVLGLPAPENQCLARRRISRSPHKNREFCRPRGRYTTLTSFRSHLRVHGVQSYLRHVFGPIITLVSSVLSAFTRVIHDLSLNVIACKALG